MNLPLIRLTREQAAIAFCCVEEEITGTVEQVLRDVDSPQFPVYWGCFTPDDLSADIQS
jgi:hypothetical protein